MCFRIVGDASFHKAMQLLALKNRTLLSSLSLLSSLYIVFIDIHIVNIGAMIIVVIHVHIVTVVVTVVIVHFIIYCYQNHYCFTVFADNDGISDGFDGGGVVVVVFIDNRNSSSCNSRSLLLHRTLDRDACCHHRSSCPPQLLQVATELVCQWYWFWPYVLPQSIM